MAITSEARASPRRPAKPQMVIKNTFLEFAWDKVSATGPVRRICSDPAMYSKEDGRDGNKDSATGTDARPSDKEDHEVDEFQLVGLSDAETEPETLSPGHAMLSCYQHLPDLVPCPGSSCSEGVDSGHCCDARAAEAELAEAQRFIRTKLGGQLHLLTEEGVRSEMKIKLIEENARLAQEVQRLRQMLSQPSTVSEAEDQAGLSNVDKQQSVKSSSSSKDAGPTRPSQAKATATASASKKGEPKAPAVSKPKRPPPNENDPVDPEATTLMLRNIPNNYTRVMVLALLDAEGFAGCYDFFYLPIDFHSRASLGYAFVNLVSAYKVLDFWRNFDGFNGWVVPSRKVCKVGWAGPHQGFQAHVDRYKGSPVMHETVPDDFKPVVFKDGIRVDFPAPEKPPRAPRVRQRDGHRQPLNAQQPAEQAANEADQQQQQQQQQQQPHQQKPLMPTNTQSVGLSTSVVAGAAVSKRAFKHHEQLQQQPQPQQQQQRQHMGDVVAQDTTHRHRRQGL